MIFKCYCCSKFRWKKKDTYRVDLRDGSGNVIITKYLCNPCGDEINNIYDAGRKLVELSNDRETESF